MLVLLVGLLLLRTLRKRVDHRQTCLGGAIQQLEPPHRDDRRVGGKRARLAPVEVTPASLPRGGVLQQTIGDGHAATPRRHVAGEGRFVARMVVTGKEPRCPSRFWREERAPTREPVPTAEVVPGWSTAVRHLHDDRHALGQWLL